MQPRLQQLTGLLHLLARCPLLAVEMAHLFPALPLASKRVRASERRMKQNAFAGICGPADVRWQSMAIACHSQPPRRAGLWQTREGHGNSHGWWKQICSLHNQCNVLPPILSWPPCTGHDTPRCPRPANRIALIAAKNSPFPVFVPAPTWCSISGSGTRSCSRCDRNLVEKARETSEGKLIVINK